MTAPATPDEFAVALRLLEAANEACPVGMLLLDVAGRVATCNHRFLELWGLSRPCTGLPAEVVGRVTAVSEGSGRTEGTAEMAVLPAGSVHDRLELVDGRVIDRYKAPLRSPAGERLGDVYYFKDSTAEVRYRRRLKAQIQVARVLGEFQLVDAALPALLAAIGESLGCAVGTFWIVKGSHLKLQAAWHSAGREYARFLGRARRLSVQPGSGFLGKAWLAGAPVWAPDLGKEGGFLRAKAARQEGLHSGFAFPVMSHGRTFGIMEFFFTWHLAPDAETTELVAALASQISQAIERQQAREEAELRGAEARKALAERVASLQEVDRVKRAFLDTASHEMRTPLTRIISFAEFLEDGLAGPLTPAQLEFPHEIQQGARDVTRFVDDMLELARIQAGKFQLELREADLSAIAQSVMDGLAGAARAGNIRLRAAFPPDPVRLLMDAPRVAQAVDALVSNAIKFTPAGGWVRVACRGGGEHVRFSVRDSGIGIPADVLPRVFDKFFQVDYGTTRAFGGTGLGLALARAVVEAHGGRIGARSALGKGSLFWFTLPRRPRLRATLLPEPRAKHSPT
ncbi:MAG: GAF domain-containing protein [Candidatus Sericytochromatia bacterium]|nr:GAF domain-containing protein [Candidatus Tanganyikabacteria bacterium]